MRVFKKRLNRKYDSSPNEAATALTVTLLIHHMIKGTLVFALNLM